MPIDALLAEDSVTAGVSALERIHGRHLADMTADEQAEARDHWRRQVEQILASVHVLHGGSDALPGAGRAVVTFVDAGEERVDVSVTFQPDLEELADGQVAGTPAQVLALTALEALSDEEQAEPE